jgi:uncharacterized membrane protein
LVARGRDVLGRIENSIEITAPPEKVWEMLPLDRLPEWVEGYKGELKSVEYTSEVRTPKDKLRVGASAHGIPKKQGKPIKFNFEITESLENEKITYRLYGNYRAFVTHILKPLEKGTKMTHIIDYEMPWSILGKILEPLFFRRLMRKEFERDLQNFKKHSGEIDAQ